MDADSIIAKYRQACAAGAIVPLPDDVAMDRLREVWAAFHSIQAPETAAKSAFRH